jgi:GNAT superfamily N-acetyltransferase
MPNIRLATLDDADLITNHRHTMFADNNLATESHLTAMDTNFNPWVRRHLAAGTYIGLLLEDETSQKILASAGIFLQDFPPHWLDIEPTRAYLLNFYTTPEARGRGFANLLLRACVDECRQRNIGVITLHASTFGKPIYEKFGFKQSNEMMYLFDQT